MSPFVISGSQSIGASTSALVLPINVQGWILEWVAIPFSRGSNPVLLQWQADSLPSEPPGKHPKYVPLPSYKGKGTAPYGASLTAQW